MKRGGAWEGNARPDSFNLLIKCNDNVPHEKRKRGDYAVGQSISAVEERPMSNLSSDQEYKGLESEHSS